MTNKVYDIKIAESHLQTTIEALAALPFGRVNAIIVSLLQQARAQSATPANDAAPAPQVEAAE